MKKLLYIVILSFGISLLTGCAGINFITIQTYEPAQVQLPERVHSVLIVNNAATQPSDIGHTRKPIGKHESLKVIANADSIPTIYCGALAQFLSEENHFDNVKLYSKPLRSDHHFWEENPIDPEIMNALRNETGTDALISLDKVVLQTEGVDFFRQEGYIYGGLTGKINSILRVYLPSMEGKIPAIEYSDSLHWEGFDIRDGKASADLILPTPEQAMKELALNAAEKMTYVFVPHWENQSRWYYTSSNSLMKEAEVLVKADKWAEAISKWETLYNNEKNKHNKAKLASNIAFAYEMLDDMNSAYDWINISKQLFDETTTEGSLDRKRAELYKNEITRRRDNYNKAKEQAFD
jgi:hypothetical protein